MGVEGAAPRPCQRPQDLGNTPRTQLIAPPDPVKLARSSGRNNQPEGTQVYVGTSSSPCQMSLALPHPSLPPCLSLLHISPLHSHHPSSPRSHLTPSLSSSYLTLPSPHHTSPFPSTALLHTSPLPSPHHTSPHLTPSLSLPHPPFSPPNPSLPLYLFPLPTLPFLSSSYPLFPLPISPLPSLYPIPLTPLSSHLSYLLCGW